MKEKRKVDPAEQARYEINEALNPRNGMDDEPTVIGTDPGKKFAKLREKMRQSKELKRYVAILNKHGEDSRQDKEFILELIKRGDGDVLGLCNAAKLVRGETRKQPPGCASRHDASTSCVICWRPPKTPEKKRKKPSK